MPVFHREGGIAIVVFVHLLNDGPADLANECHQRPGRQCCGIELLVKNQHSPLRPREVRRRLLFRGERELQHFNLRPLLSRFALRISPPSKMRWPLYDSGEVSTSLNVRFLSI